MKKLYLLKTMLLLCALVVGSGSAWADTYEQLTSIAYIDESAEYVLGIDGTGFHYEGTSSWGKTALPSAQTPIKYKLTKASDGNSFTAKATISGTTYYLQVPTSNDFSMATSEGQKTDLIIGTTQVSETNYAVANKTTTDRHLRINGTSGLRSYANETGTMAFFYKVISFAITAQSNNTDYGTVSLSGSVITGSPKSEYRYADPAYTVSPANSATVVQDGNNFTVTPSENTTVTINFEAIPKHTVTYSVNGTTTTQDFMEGEAITFPDDPAAVDEKVFVGWVTGAIDGTTDTAPSFVTSATMDKSDITYYAVFANVIDNGSGTYTLDYNEEADLSSSIDWGSYGTAYAYTASDGSKWTVKAYKNAGMQINTGKSSSIKVPDCPENITSISITCSAAKAVGFSADDYSGSGTISYLAEGRDATSQTLDLSEVSAKGGYIVPKGGSTSITKIVVNYGGITISNYCTTVVAAAVAKPVITVAENPFLFSTTASITCATEGAAIKYSFDGETWSDYSEPLTITSTTAIYAKAEKDEDVSAVASVTATKNLAEPTLTIDAAGITNTDVYVGTAAGSLSASVKYNDKDVEGVAVTWSGDNDEVATINASTGEVTLVAEGTVTFTATFAGNDDYSEKTASYEMTVTSSAPYVQPTTIEIVPNYTFWGKTDQFSGNTYDNLSGSQDNVSLSWNRGNGSTYANTSGMRFYKYNTLTFTAPEDYEIKSIVIDGTLKEDEEFYPEGFDVTSKTWLGSSSTVTMSRPSNADSYATYSKFTITIGLPSSIAAPTFSFESGAYATSLSVELSCATDGASIYYTIDGTTPNASSTPYTGPISVTTTTTIKAVAIKDGELSNYSIANYYIKKDVVLNIDDKSLPFGDSYTITSGTYSTRDVQTDGEVSISSSNPSVVSVNGLSITATAVGTATITVTATEGDTYKAGNATFDVTVAAPEGQTEALPTEEVTLFHETFGDNHDSARDWNNSFSVKSGVATVYSGITGYTVTNAKQSKNTTGSKQSGLIQTTSDTDASIIIGPLNVANYSDMTLTYQWKAASIKGTYSTSVYYSTSAEGEYTEITGTGDGATTFVERSYTLPAAAQVANLYLKIVWNTSNTQAVIDEVNLSYISSSSETVKLNGSGYATYCSQYPLDFSDYETADYSAWKITSISDNTITFEQITGSVKSGTGIFLKGTANAEVTINSVNSTNELSGNLLVGTLAPTYVTDNQYYGLSGNYFVKVNAGTVPAGKALLPASLVDGTNARLTFVFVDATGIKAIEHSPFATDDAIYNLSGQRVVSPKKGFYIVNGKKVMLK